jgi:hypothetical protein
MADRLTGNVTFPKEMWDRDILGRDPANTKSALMDLWTWANDRQRTIKVNGRDVVLQRGQLAYAQGTLAGFWHWSRPKVHKVLVELQDEGFITFQTSSTVTVITVLDYDIYNRDTAAELHPDVTTDFTPEITPDFTQKYEGGRRKKEEKEEPGTKFPESVSDDLVMAFAVNWPGEPASGTPVIEIAWVADFLVRINGRREWPLDWRRFMVACWRKEWRAFGVAASRTGTEKNGAKKTGEVSESVAVIERRKVAGELESLENAEQADRELGLQPDTARRQRIKELRLIVGGGQ